MHNLLKRILCMMFIFTFLLSAEATNTFAADYLDEDMEVIWSDNQFLNPGFEYDTSSSDNMYWRAVSVYRNIEGATANPGSSSGFTLPFDTNVKNGGNRSLKIVETNTDSYIDIMRIKDYYSNGSNIRDGAYEDGYKKFNISAYYKNISNVKGVQLRIWYESKATWAAVFIHDSEVVNLDGDNWTKVSWDIDLDTITATEGDNEGEVFDAESPGSGNIRIRFTPVAEDESVICKYNIDDIEIKYLKSEGYKYKNLVEDKVSSCDDVEGFKKYVKSGCNSSKSLESEIVHSGENSLKATGSAWDVLAGFKPTADLIAGQPYYLSVWVYSTAQQKIFARYAYSNMNNIVGWVPGNTSQSSLLTAPKDKWVKYEIIFTPEANMIDSLQYMYFTAGGNDDVYFDDITLRKHYDGNVSLVSSSPSDNEEEVKLNRFVELEFSKEAETNDIEIEYYINDEKQPNDVFNIEKDGYMLNIKQDGGLVPDSDYKIIIKRINDIWGRKVVENMEMNFSTAAKAGFDVEVLDGTAKIDIQNNSGAPLGARCVIMACEGERVKKVYATDQLNLSTDETKKGIELELTNLPANCYLKAFLWTDATKDLRALAGCIKIE